MSSSNDSRTCGPMSSEPGSGIHLIGEWSGCRVRNGVLTRASDLAELCVVASREVGLTVVGHSAHQFEPEGSTVVILLAESHLAIHTWPELAFVTADVFVCNLVDDNGSKAWALWERLKTEFSPTSERLTSVNRSKPQLCAQAA
jgi:S-adenosylmethionine decarboxylase proenzyme